MQSVGSQTVVCQFLLYGGCQWFAYVWEGSDNGKNAFVCGVRWDNKLLHV